MSVRGGWAFVVLACACSSSSSGESTAHHDGGAMSHADGSSKPDSAGGKDATSTCPTSNACTGTVSGGVTATITTCSVSGEDGVAAGFGEVTFSFTASGGDGGAAVTGSGNVSTTGKFEAGAYTSDAGLWNDTTTGVAADSLWSVTWTGDAGASAMAVCNGIASPDETPNVCTNASLDVTAVDACSDLHGSFDVTIPAYQGASEVTVHLSF